LLLLVILTCAILHMLDKPIYNISSSWLQVFGGGYAAINYNLGASDFKETPAYKESQSQELLEPPETSESDIFESNPTEVAPSLN